MFDLQMDSAEFVSSLSDGMVFIFTSLDSNGDVSVGQDVNLEFTVVLPSGAAVPNLIVGYINQTDFRKNEFNIQGSS